jgi:hypothetical protein
MRTRLICFATMVVLLASAPRVALSQQDSADSKTAAPAQQPAPKHYYKLLFVLRETDEGKVLNQRTFTMDISAEPPRTNGVPLDWWHMRSGTRVPFSGSKDVNYIDVGVNLDVRAEEAPEALQMQITSEISSVASETAVGVSAPAVRQLKISGAVWAPLGKPTVIFTADDAASKHRFELEVTPTRAK